MAASAATVTSYRRVIEVHTRDGDLGGGDVTYGMSTRMALPFETAVQRVRDVLAAQGFGVLTEIDVKATMKAKLDADMEDYVILGACNPPLAHRALDAERSVGLLLPCNVVVRAAGTDATIVEILDPKIIAEHTDAPLVREVAADAAERLTAVVAELEASANAA
jgi:uncharacterized protein (DUF302 family)